MKYLCIICFLLTLASCKNKDKVDSIDISGTWLLANLKPIDRNFWTSKNQVPTGFRFYSTDSAEVYRANYFTKYDRFTSYKATSDSIYILQSDSLGWWKHRVQIDNDTLTIYRGYDTIIYHRLFNNTNTSKKRFDKIVLATGSSWGNLITVVIYPNDKTIVYIRDRDKIQNKSFIRQTPGLFAQMLVSLQWVRQIENHESFRLFEENFDSGVTFDGAFSEMLLLSKDSTWLNKKGQMKTFQSHLLGLQGYAFSKIFKGDYLMNSGDTTPPLTYDSVRTIIPLCRLEGILNHYSVLAFVMESINTSRRLAQSHEDLNICFQVNCSPKEQWNFCTNGQIVSVNYFDRYDVGYNFIDILQKY